MRAVWPLIHKNRNRTQVPASVTNFTDRAAGIARRIDQGCRLIGLVGRNAIVRRKAREWRVIDALLGDDQLANLIFSNWSLPRDCQWYDRHPLKAWLSKRNAIVTGVAPGTGSAIVRRFASRRLSRYRPGPFAR
jgi:hypothetical protein